MARRRGRKSPPLKCGDTFELRCLTDDPKGIIFSCKVFPRHEKPACADAEINILKGEIRFYG